MRQRATLEPATLKSLLVEESVSSVCIQDAEDGFSIRIEFGDGDKLLGLVKKDRARVFRTLKGAKTHLAKLGIEDFRVDATRRSLPARGDLQAARPLYESEADIRESIDEIFAQLDAGTAELTPWTFGDGRRWLKELEAEHEAAMASDPRYRERYAASQRKTIEPFLLDVLVTVDSIKSVRIQEVEGGFCILIRSDEAEQPLGLVKEDRTRAFKTRKSAERHLNKLGIAHLDADATRAKTRMPAKATKRTLLN